MKLTLMILTLLLISACSNRGIYEGLQANQRFECTKLPPVQYQQCMKDANKSFDQYELERKEATR